MLIVDHTKQDSDIFVSNNDWSVQYKKAYM